MYYCNARGYGFSAPVFKTNPAVGINTSLLVLLEAYYNITQPQQWSLPAVCIELA